MAIQEEQTASGPQAPEGGALPESIPQPTEEIHLPEPSYLPVVLAFGTMVALVGIVITWVLCVLGGVIALVALYKWIRQAREEMAELPLEH